MCSSSGVVSSPVEVQEQGQEWELRRYRVRREDVGYHRFLVADERNAQTRLEVARPRWPVLHLVLHPVLPLERVRVPGEQVFCVVAERDYAGHPVDCSAKVSTMIQCRTSALGKGGVPCGTALLPFEPTAQTVEMKDMPAYQLLWRLVRSTFSPWCCFLRRSRSGSRHDHLFSADDTDPIA